jgi:hypothetical protein
MFTFQSKPSSSSKRSGHSSSSRTILQPKLKIHTGYDRHEQEADRAAEQVLRGTEPRSFTPKTGGAAVGVQRECHCGGTCAECKAGQSGGEHQHMQLSPAASSGAGVHAPPVVNRVLNSPGRPLDPQTRAFMEPRFGFDFSNVRLHSGEEAERSARDVNALAYTVGPNIVFAKGQYQPAEQSGRRLLAHELAHVVQQSSSPARLQRQQPPPAPPPKKKDEAPACTFSIRYVKDKDIPCDTLFEQQKGKKPPGKMCGRAVQYNVESVSANGPKCPPLKGLKFTETKQIDPGKASCLPAGATLPASDGCVIGDNGKITGCTDIYSLCGPLAGINELTNAGCENTYTQKLFVDGKEVETHKIHFDMDTTATTCTTKMTRDGTPIP